MRDGPKVPVLTKAKELPACTKVSTRRVVEGVRLEGAGGVKVKSERRKHELERRRIGDGELKFDLGGLHLGSIRRIAPSDATDKMKR